LPGPDQAKLHLTNNVPRWNRVGSVYTRGSAVLDGRLLKALEISEQVAKLHCLEDLVSFLRRLNGFFATVHVLPDAMFLAADHVRSLPLFYAVDGDNLYVSDDAWWVREQIRDEGIDERSAIEFLVSRIVSGSDTLSPKVKQIQAGEVIALTESSKHGLIKKSVRYYEFGNVGRTTASHDQLAEKHDRYLRVAFQRLIEYANGRTIVVPLSGGLDSRLILLMLKQLGYKEVISFSYGRPGNRESEISRKVAGRLRFPWQFIPYGNEEWFRWYNSEEWKAYVRFAHGLCSTPHIQAWPAVWELKKARMVPEDSIFVPGHLALRDHPALPTEWLNSGRIDCDELINEICDRFCTLIDWSFQSETVRPRLTSKIGHLIEAPSTMSTDQAITYFDRWWWEVESKFFLNSVRGYEFWGYEWWLPFWDLELANFWRTLPLSLRFERQFHRASVRKMETNVTSRSTIPDASMYTLNPLILKTLDRFKLRKPAGRIHALFDYYRHPLAWYGIMPKSEYVHAFSGQEDINTYLANQTLKTIFPNFKIPPGLDFLAKPSVEITSQE